MSIKEIVNKIFSYGDMFTMSAKKDTIVNIGGLIGIKDDNSPIILKVKANCISFEGFFLLMVDFPDVILKPWQLDFTKESMKTS